jgi:hypothetical protein
MRGRGYSERSTCYTNASDWDVEGRGNLGGGGGALARYLRPYTRDETETCVLLPRFRCSYSGCCVCGAEGVGGGGGTVKHGV